MEIEADVPNLDTVIGFIEKSIKGLKLTEEELSLISIIVEELFVNIASYA